MKQFLSLCLVVPIVPVLPLQAQLVPDGGTHALANVIPGTVTVGTNGSFTALTLADNTLLTNSAQGVIGRNATAQSVQCGRPLFLHQRHRTRHPATLLPDQHPVKRTTICMKTSPLSELVASFPWSARTGPRFSQATCRRRSPASAALARAVGRGPVGATSRPSGESGDEFFIWPTS
jgi:hypothetical protein